MEARRTVARRWVSTAGRSSPTRFLGRELRRSTRRGQTGSQGGSRGSGEEPLQQITAEEKEPSPRALSLNVSEWNPHESYAQLSAPIHCSPPKYFPLAPPAFTLASPSPDRAVR